MAFTFDAPIKEIRVVVYRDDAVGCTLEDYKDEYLPSFGKDGIGNEEILKLSGEPTRFVLSLRVGWDRKRNIERENVTIDAQTGQPVLQSTYLTDLVRASLTGIENPEGVPPAKALKFKRDSDQMVHKSLIDLLETSKQLGYITSALVAARAFIGGSDEERDQEKN